jgi:hypothetical protein
MLVVYNGVAKFRQAGKSAVFAMCSFLDSSFGSFTAITLWQVALFRRKETMVGFEYSTPPAGIGAASAENLGMVFLRS